MFHYPQRNSKTGRVVPKDSSNLGLHYSLQGQASTVNERRTARQCSVDNKTVLDNDLVMMPSVSNPVITPSTRLQFPPTTEAEPAGKKTVTSIQTAHSAPDSSELKRQQQNLQTFHELNKVQRQILHPVPASMTDTFSLVANITQNREAFFKPQGRNSTPCRATCQLDRQLNDALLPVQTSMSSLPSIQPCNQAIGKVDLALGDCVIFTESSASPGVPVVYRLPEDRHANPDRLNLDRRKLSGCPILEGEDHVRLLNFQHNLITEIENISQLKRLIFLDFYDNQLECISGLSALKSLRVLMLGKNRIRNIENLDGLTKLDVLDLHGNKISQINNLNHLSELRVLNLAGNDIVSVNNMSGMQSLAELNLRRNKIITVSGINHLPNLQRLFLSFNCIQSFDDIRCLSQSPGITELSLDGNPLALETSYKHNVLRNVRCLRQFDMKRISEEERRVANVIAKKEDEKRKEHGRITHVKEKKRIAINNAQRQWEKFHISTIEKSFTCSNIVTKSEPYLSKTSTCQTLIQSLLYSSSTTSTGDQQEESSDLTICHLAELEGDTLFLYGPGSLDALDRNWGQQAINTLTTVAFKFIDYDDIVPHIGKLQAKFPVIQKLVFASTNINSLQQINALAVIKHLECLTIKDGNPVTSFTLWKPYILFRLAHLSLRQLNDVEITAEDIVKAEKIFGSLSHVTTSYLPQSRLLSLLGDTSKQQNLDCDKVRRNEDKHERSLSSEGLGRAGLQYRYSHKNKEESKIRKNFSENYVIELLQNCVGIHHDNKKLEALWPKVLSDIAQEYVQDMAHLDTFIKKNLENI